LRFALGLNAGNQQQGSAGIRPLIAGNWKMNGISESLANVREIGMRTEPIADAVDVIVFPPATLLESAAAVGLPYRIAIGGQDCSSETNGAFTGELSAEMLSDAGATFALLGHSERRRRHCETDENIRQKAIRAIDANLKAVICVGESLDEKAAGDTLTVLSKQILHAVPRTVNSSDLVIAYEPVWAIGTGRRPEDQEISEAHAHIRGQMEAVWGEGGRQIPILYGGSVDSKNAKTILRLPNVNGLLIGAASLDAAHFSAICSDAAGLASANLSI